MQNTSFNHSVKVPRLYKCAAKISQKVAEGGGSVKQLVYEKTHFNTKALYALVVTTCQKAKEIDLLLKRTKLLEKEPRLDPWLAKILISEVLWGKKQLPKSDAKPIQTILAYEQAFHAHLSDSSENATAVNQEKHKKPRYVRINTLINPFNEALELFQDEGWTLQTNTSNDYDSFLKQVSNLEGDFMLKDMHIPDVLIFPGGTEFYNHPGYRKGALVLQDKASCLPVHLLSPPPGSVILDMCAAPGMKTTQLATALDNQGTIYAVERDSKRFEVLNKMVKTSGATCIKTINRDVLECGGTDFPDVEYILVDPSCSASGMTDRLELQQNRNHLRLQKLAGFQIKILRSALTRYPKVKKVVYSTCSLYPEENEDVVRQVLETNNEFKLIPAEKCINKAWKNFGSPDFGDIGKYCLYARPEEDLTNGFFMAIFERLEEEENNQFFNGRVLNYRKNVEQKQARKERKFKERVEGGENFEVLDEGKKSKDEKVRDINKNNVEDQIYSNAYAHLEKKKKNKRKADDVNTLDQDLENGNIHKVSKKHKKEKQKYVESENGTKNKDESNNDVAEGLENEITNEPIKKDKKKKRKDNEDEIVMQIDDKNNEIDNSLLNCKKKKRRDKKVTDFRPSNNENENKQKKRKHREINHLEQTYEETKKIIVDGVIEQDTENIIQNLVGNINESLKKNKKKKRKEEDTISIENAVDKLINKSLKKSIKKTKKQTDFENIDEELETKIYDDLFTKSEKKTKA